MIELSDTSGLMGWGSILLLSQSFGGQEPIVNCRFDRDSYEELGGRHV
jgi:hypothetical protein